MKEILQGVVAVLVIGGMIFGAINYFATAEDLKLTQQRLEQKIVGDAILDIQKRMWQLEERNNSRDCSKWRDSRDREEYKKLELLLELEKRKLEKK